MERMDRLRADLIRRARLERAADEEQAIPAREMEEHPQARTSRFPLGLFRRQEPPVTDRHVADSQVASPKSPDFNPRTLGLPPRRVDLPNLAGTQGDDLSRPQVVAASPPQPARTMPVPPRPVAAVSSQSSTPVIDAPDPADVHLAQLAEDGRRRRRRRDRGTRTSSSRKQKKKTPKRFLFCCPWVKSQRMRICILRCFVSGMFLCSLLAVYLGLVMTKKINKGELTIVLILIVLLATVWFCYSLMQLCMLVVRGDRDRVRQDHATYIGSGGYVVPPQPIRVVMARDEEEAGVESENVAAKYTPPAYGVWRESVRVDPNRLFWQRNEAAAEEEGMPRRPETTFGPRPPSYASDDGVSYVVEAAPRSTAPREDVPLHPSEFGRMGETRPTW